MILFKQHRLAGETVEETLTISLRKAYTGTTETLHLSHVNVCPRCRGTGRRPPLLMYPPVLSTCPLCHGQGKAERSRRRVIDVPPGIADGAQFRFVGEGQPGLRDAPAGDLVVTIRIRPHCMYDRQGDDLLCTMAIDQGTAQRGGRRSLLALNGCMHTVEIPQGIHQHQQLCFPGAGMPRSDGRGFGNLYVQVTISAGVGAPSPTCAHPLVVQPTLPASPAAPLPLPATVAAGSGAPTQGRQPGTLGNYHLLQRLGAGGQAEVYLAKHRYLNTRAAIKLSKEHLTTEAEQRFLSEAQIIARLHHPHIIRLLDYGIERGTPYLVMDYAEQGTIRDRHPHGTQVPLTRVITYVQQIAAALQYAHDQRLVHRDVKPENMLVDAEGNLVLSDFGIAVQAHATRSLTLQEAIGTVSYMAPEQINGKPRPASDQYALAVVVYEWLCGACPFLGENAGEIIMQHLTASPPSLRKQVPGLSAAVEKVVLRALAKDPHQRFATVQAFADALTAAARM